MRNKTKKRVTLKHKEENSRNKQENRKDKYKKIRATAKQKTFKKVQCSPKDKNELKSFTCYTDKNLHKMRDIWNARHPDHPIKTNDSKEIWKLFKENYSRICDRESCWVKQMVKGTTMEKKILEDFAPKAPNSWQKNKNTWLSSLDILEVMTQYEKSYKCFEFMGPSPIDYDTHKLYGSCVWEELCHFNLQEQIQKGKTKIGIIFNTDPHYLDGSHWISLFINIRKGQILFFDSAGDKIPVQVKKFVNNVIEQGRKLAKPIAFEFDEMYPIEHQKGNSECGVYSLYFIIHMLQDKVTKEYLKTHRIPDEYVNKYRKIYFNEKL